MHTTLLTVALLFVGLNVYTFFRRQTYRQTGFGDLLPIGPARLFSLLEAAIAILLLTALFVKSMYKKED